MAVVKPFSMIWIYTRENLGTIAQKEIHDEVSFLTSSLSLVPFFLSPSLSVFMLYLFMLFIFVYIFDNKKGR